MSIVELQARVEEQATVIARLCNIVGLESGGRYDGLISTKEAMRRMGYASAKGFIAAARGAGVRRVRLNARAFRWAQGEIEDWRARREVGGMGRNGGKARG